MKRVKREIKWNARRVNSATNEEKINKTTTTNCVVLGCCEYLTDNGPAAARTHLNHTRANCKLRKFYLFSISEKSIQDIHTHTDYSIHIQTASGICTPPFRVCFVFYASAIIRHMKIRYSTVVSSSHISKNQFKSSVVIVMSLNPFTVAHFFHIVSPSRMKSSSRRRNAFFHSTK